MNTALLRKMRYQRQRGLTAWVWDVPGYNNPIVLHKVNRTWEAPSVSWPRVDTPGKGLVRMARLDWHRSVIRGELTKLLQMVAERCGNV